MLSFLSSLLGARRNAQVRPCTSAELVEWNADNDTAGDAARHGHRRL